MRPRTVGETAVRAFETVTSGQKIAATVIELEQPPAEQQRLLVCATVDAADRLRRALHDQEHVRLDAGP